MKIIYIIIVVSIVGCSSYEPKKLDRTSLIEEVENASIQFNSKQEEGFNLEDGINLDEAILIGLLKNPILIAERFKSGVSEAQIKIAGQLENPTLSLDFTKASSGGVQNYEWEIVQNLSSFITRSTKIEHAEFQKKKAKLELQQLEFQTVNEIKEKYIRAHFLHEQYKSAIQIKAMIKKLKDISQVKYEAGKIPLIDVNAIDIELLKVSQLELSAKTNYGLAILGLIGEIGLSPEYKATLCPKSPFESLPESSLSIEDLKTFALSKKLNLDILEMDYEKAEKELELIYLSRIPSIEVGPKFDNSTEGNASGFLLGIEVPIWNRKTGEIEYGKAKRLLIEKELYAAITTTIFNVNQSFLKFKSSLMGAKNFSSNVIEKSQKNVDLAQEFYRQGKIDLSKVILAQNQLIESQQLTLDLAFQHRLNLIELESSAGGTIQHVKNYIEKSKLKASTNE